MRCSPSAIPSRQSTTCRDARARPRCGNHVADIETLELGRRFAVVLLASDFVNARDDRELDALLAAVRDTSPPTAASCSSGCRPTGARWRERVASRLRM